LTRALRTDGLTLPDVQVQQLSFPDSLAALRGGSLAASFPIEPFITLGKQQSVLEMLVSSEKVAPGREITEVFYAARFAENRAAASNFMAAYLQGVRDYVDTFFRQRGDRALAVSQLVQHLAVKDPSLYDRMGMPAVNPDGRINAADVKSPARLVRRPKRGAAAHRRDPGGRQLLRRLRAQRARPVFILSGGNPCPHPAALSGAGGGGRSSGHPLGDQGHQVLLGDLADRRERERVEDLEPFGQLVPGDLFAS
jgi:hypothetical protein